MDSITTNITGGGAALVSFILFADQPNTATVRSASVMQQLAESVVYVNPTLSLTGTSHRGQNLKKLMYSDPINRSRLYTSNCSDACIPFFPSSPSRALLGTSYHSIFVHLKEMHDIQRLTRLHRFRTSPHVIDTVATIHRMGVLHQQRVRSYRIFTQISTPLTRGTTTFTTIIGGMRAYCPFPAILRDCLHVQ